MALDFAQNVTKQLKKCKDWKNIYIKKILLFLADDDADKN